MPDEGELRRILDRGVPEEALRFFGRWWQLETYLREVVYVELRCKYGIGYAAQLDRRALDRAKRDRKKNAYMASADDEDPLAYVDTGGLLDLIDQHWDLFSEALMPRDRWTASAEMLRELRNRVSHCRRPHKDDLGRLLQLLRDLEHGAQRFFSSYNSDYEVSDKDPFIKAWVKGKHPDAARLLERAGPKYETNTRVRLSRRPWAADPTGSTVSGKPGYLWHVEWSIGARRLRPTDLWAQVRRLPQVDERIVHLLFWYPSLITATFASVDEGNVDAVGPLFEALLTRCRQAPPEPDADRKEEGLQWRADVAWLPRRAQVDTALAIFDPCHPEEVFAADEAV